MNIILGVMMFFELLVFVIAICNCASKSCVDKETEGTVAMMVFVMLIIEMLLKGRI